MASSNAVMMFDLVEQTPLKSMSGVLSGMEAIASRRKSSKILSTHFQCDIFGAQDARSLALLAALYFEHIAIRRTEQDEGGRRKKGLSAEVKSLHADGIIDEELRDNMQTIVRLRNEFAHNLYYDISEWQPISAPFFTNRHPRMPRARHLRAAKNLVLVKILLVEIYEGLHEALPWLSFENVPKAFRRRSINLLNPPPLRGGS